MRKEAGSYYYTKCLECGGELAAGWLSDEPQPTLAGEPGKIITASRDEQGVVSEPQVCGCGKTRLYFDPKTGRGVVEWDTAQEPRWQAAIRWGSLRDMARQ